MVDGQGSDDLGHFFRPYLQILQGPDAKFSVQPPPAGIPENRFQYADVTPSHLVIRNLASKREYYVPLVMIEFVNPPARTRTAEPPYGVIVLKRPMKVHGDDGGSFI